MTVDLTNLISNRSLYHAKRGNFSGFRVSLPIDINEENGRFLFDNIRSLMEDVAEEEETWFDYEEFVEYYNNPLNKIEPLMEAVSLQTRIKLSRAAKRTSKRRARKRFMRRKIRKNKGQLAKRAYGQIKTILRKRLTGGRDWSSISLSSRMRIDAAINKRKSILTRMVKTRIPKMASQETARLQRVRINSSAEYTNIPFLSEDNKQEIVSQQNKKRQQKYRASLTGNITSFMNNLMVVKNRKGKELIITKQSYDKNEHEVLEKPKSLTLSKAKRITGRSNFSQTPTSVKLFGLMKKEAAKKDKKESKEEEEMGSSNTSEPQTMTPDVEIPPPGPREGSTSKDSIYSDNEHTEDQMAISTTATINLLNAGYTPSVLLSQLALAQQFSRSTEVGAKTTPEERKASANIEKILKSSGISDDAVNMLMTSQTLLGAGVRSILPLLKNKNLDGIPGGDLGKYAAITTDSILFPTLPSYKNDSGNNGDEPSTSTIILFNRDIISDNSGKQLNPIQLNEECKKHMDMWNIGLGKVSDENGKELSAKNIKEAMTYVSEFLAKYGDSAMIGVSIKSGEKRNIPGVIRGEANAIVQYVLRNDDSDYDTKSIIDPNWTKVFKNFDERGDDEKKSFNISNVTTERKNINPEKFHKDIATEVVDVLCTNKHVVSDMVYQSLTGIYKFGTSSPAASSLIITQNKDGTSSSLTEITEEYSESIANNINVRIGTGVGYVNTQQDLSDGEMFDAAIVRRSKDKNIDISTARKEIRVEIQTMRDEIAKKVQTKNITLEEAQNEKLEELLESGLSKKEAQERVMLAERSYQYMTVLSIVSTMNKTNDNTGRPLREKFSYNTIMQILLEAKVSKQDAMALEDNSDSSKNEYLDNAKKWIGDKINKFLVFLNSVIDVVAYDDIDLMDYAVKETNGQVNRIYINGSIKDIPVAKEIDYDALMSEKYVRIGSLFLSENKKRDYKKEYEDFHGTPQHRKERSKRVLARRALEKMGRVHKGDGKDVDHKDGNPMNNSTDNLRVMDSSANRAKH